MLYDAIPQMDSNDDLACREVYIAETFYVACVVDSRRSSLGEAGGVRMVNPLCFVELILNINLR